MSSRAFQAQRLGIAGVNENPIRFDVAVARAAPISPQCMISMPGSQSLALRKLPDNLLELGNIFASLCHPPHVLDEPSGLPKLFHFFQLANIFSRESNDSTPSPF